MKSKIWAFKVNRMTKASQEDVWKYYNEVTKKSKTPSDNWEASSAKKSLTRMNL